MGQRWNKIPIYSIIFVCSGIVLNVFIGGMVWSSGLFYVIFLDALDYDSSSEVALSTSLNVAIYYGVGPVGGVLIRRLGCRATGILGGLMTGSGLVLAILSTDVYYIGAMFGVISGAGLGFSNMSFTISVTEYFTKYRPIVYGICTSATGLGGFLFPIVIRQLLHSYGWRGTLLILGGIMFNMIVCTAIIRQEETRNIKERNSRSSKQSNSTLSIYKHLFSNLHFKLLCISNVFVCMGRSVVTVHLGAYAIANGINEDNAALLYSTFGAASIVGYILFGSLIQIPGCTGLHTYIAGFALAGVATLLMALFSNYIPLHCLMGLFGLVTATHAVSNLEIMILFCGDECAPIAWGVLLLFVAIGQGIGGPVASLLYQATQDYAVPMYYGAAVTAFGVIIMSVPLISRFGCFGRRAIETNPTVTRERDTTCDAQDQIGIDVI